MNIFSGSNSGSNTFKKNFDDLKSEDEKKKEAAHASLKSIKHMKNLVSSFMPEEKISGILPSYIAN